MYARDDAKVTTVRTVVETEPESAGYQLPLYEQLTAIWAEQDLMPQQVAQTIRDLAQPARSR